MDGRVDRGTPRSVYCGKQSAFLLACQFARQELTLQCPFLIVGVELIASSSAALQSIEKVKARIE